jgi:hypothetical protein
LHEYLGAQRHIRAGVSCQDWHISCFRSNQYAYHFSFTCGSWLEPFLLFRLPHWWSQRHLKQHFMLLYRIRESNVPTNVYLDFRSSFSSHLHHFHASSPIVFTSASSVSRSKFAAQATIVLSPPEAVKPDMHRSKLHLHPSQQSQPTKTTTAIVTPAAASLPTIKYSAHPPQPQRNHHF